MSSRQQKVTPFNSNSSSADKRDKSGSVKVKADMSKKKNPSMEEGDSLHASLGHRLPTLPSQNHIYTHTTTITPVGAHYSPAGEFGSVARQGAGKGVYSYGGAPNTKGDNALGRAMNKVGEKSGYPKAGKKSGGGGRGA